MFEAIPLPVAMPLGVETEGEPTAFQIEIPYGLRETSNPELELSHSLQISTDADAEVSKLYALVRGRLRFIPATGSEAAQLHLQPLPFEQVQLGERLRCPALPNLIIYGNVEPSSVQEAAELLLQEADFEAGEFDSARDEFMNGDRWLTVTAGAFIGRPAIDAALSGRRRLNLIMKDNQDFFINPAHFLFQWPDIDPELEDHPLLRAMETEQHTMLFATKSRKIYVKQGSGNQPPYTSVFNAAHSINDALGVAEPGDSVVVLDSSTYNEKIVMRNGVTLTSTAILRKPDRISENPTGFPTISDPNSPGATVIFENLSQPTNLSGFIITGGNGENGNGIRISNCNKVEIIQNEIHSNSLPSPGGAVVNRNLLGGGIAVTQSRRVTIERNVIRDNIERASIGGGVYLYKSEVKLFNNGVYKNRAAKYGGGVAVIECNNVILSKNEIRENEVTGEHAKGGGGIAIADSIRINLRDNQVRQNCVEGSSGQGGGIGVFSSEAEISKNTIEENVTVNFGGGIAVISSRYVTIANNVIGGATANQGNRVTGQSLDVADAIFYANPQGGGGGIGIYGELNHSTEVKIKDNHIRHNEAHRGGGIEFYAYSYGEVDHNTIEHNKTRNPNPTGFLKGGDGGGIAINHIATNRTEAERQRPIALIDNTIEHNEAGDDGGGLYATAGADVRLSGSFQKIRNNTARSNGGGIRISFGTKLRIIDGEVSNNCANLGGGNEGGGGIAVRNSKAQLQLCDVKGNSVDNFGGGGVYVSLLDQESWGDLIPGVPTPNDMLQNAFLFDKGEIEVLSCTVENNEAKENRGAGGGLYVVYDKYDVRVHILNTKLTPNPANHTESVKRKNIVLQDTSSFPDPIINDDNFTSLDPVGNYDQTLSP
jgi:hypothetical protein